MRRGARGACDLAIWFPRSLRELKRSVGKIGVLQARGLWIAWPKRAGGLESDLTQVLVRKAGLAAGLVDYKVCAIDPTWSGLKFTRVRGK